MTRDTRRFSLAILALVTLVSAVARPCHAIDVEAAERALTAEQRSGNIEGTGHYAALAATALPMSYGQGMVTAGRAKGSLPHIQRGTRIRGAGILGFLASLGVFFYGHHGVSWAIDDHSRAVVCDTFEIPCNRSTGEKRSWKIDAEESMQDPAVSDADQLRPAPDPDEPTTTPASPGAAAQSAR